MGFFDRFTGGNEPLDEDESMENVAGSKESTAGLSSGKARRQFVLFKPESSSGDVLCEIADRLLNRESVIVNLEQVAKDARRFVDFLSGVAYALQGQTKKVAANTFLFTPGGIDVTGEISNPSENDLSF